MTSVLRVAVLLAAAACPSCASRLDVTLVSRGLCASRAVAKSKITEGMVTVNGAIVKKASYACDDSSELSVSGSEHRYVSRAGEKLHAALEAFQINLVGATTLDVGASTGGFTDCMLIAGASASVCVDCGHGQLHKKLCDDDRVVSLEGINARTLVATQLPL